jgi:lipopolysaccharide assembly outer membrane protein LptD (OstA)
VDIPPPDSISFPADSTVGTSRSRPENALESRVDYDAQDSIVMDALGRKTYLYNQAVVIYEDIELRAGYIALDWDQSIIHATGIVDSNGVTVQKPIFIEGGKEFETNEIRYNFETKKGAITFVSTEESDGYIRGTKVKKVNETVTYIKDGYFTTCDRTPPDYYIKSDRIKIIQDDKIVTGPAVMVIADVPTPLVLPFGMFPTESGRRSGIVIPTWGTNQRRGFNLRGGGYYWAINDYVDLKLTGDVYSRGGWALYGNTSYKKRYKGSGNLSLSYNVIKEGDKAFPDYSEQRDFNIRWRHNQDPKARPNSRFTANVNFGTGSYFRNNTNNNDFLTSQMNSSISYNWTPRDKPFNLVANMRHSQNISDGAITFTAPEVAFNMQRFFPFKRKMAVGQQRWYEKIGTQYTMNFDNRIRATDSLFYDDFTIDDASNGFQHRIPLNVNLKVFRYFTATPQFNYTERWYFERKEKYWDDQSQEIMENEISGFSAVRDFSFNTRLTTKLYGMYNFKRGKITALRHVMTPLFNFIYRPDFSEDRWGYYGEVQSDSTGNTTTYSYYEDGIYGTAPKGKQGTLALTLNNNLEMKLQEPSDSGMVTRKAWIFQSLNFSTSYNFAVDEFNLAPLTFNGRSSFLKNKIGVRFDGRFDFYGLDEENQRQNVYLWDSDRKIARLTNTSIAFTFKFRNDGKNLNEYYRNYDPRVQFLNGNLNSYVDFSIPWDLNADYKLEYRKETVEASIAQSVTIRGNVSMTPNWKVGLHTGYDLKNKQITFTSIDIYRDLHSWEMAFHWVPFGYQQSFDFYIAIKAPILSDVKLTHRKGLGNF